MKRLELKDFVKNSVEEMLNALLNHEADELSMQGRYERSDHYDRNFTTTSSDLTSHVPKLKGIQFETAIIERYRRRETPIEEAVTEMSLGGVFIRHVENITEALLRTHVFSGTTNNFNQKPIKILNNGGAVLLWKNMSMFM